jgi:NADH-quinone oxidoreductase subunit H
MAELLKLFVRASVIIVVLLTAFAYLTYLERRMLAWFQWRCGPNRVGPWGLFQPIADGVKTLLKQELIPAKSDKALYLAAPAIFLVAAFTMYSLIPVGEKVWMSNLSVGLLLFLGLSSLGSYGVILGGWSSQSPYSFLGALRSCAQIISYELGLGLALVVPVMIVGSLNLVDIANIYVSPLWSPWYLIVLLPAGALFLASALAETARVPFDLPECESEIVAGYHTEYSSMKYAMFPMAEYVSMTAMAAIAVHFFLGGWLLPGDWTFWLDKLTGGFVWGPPQAWGMPLDYWAALSLTSMGLATTLTFFCKTLVVVLVFMWIRATWPRFRYDQLMNFGWKFLLPAGLALVLAAAIMLVLVPGGDEAGPQVAQAVVYGQ